MNGRTPEEAEERMREAIALYVEEMKEKGFVLPAPAARVISVDVAT